MSLMNKVKNSTVDCAVNVGEDKKYSYRIKTIDMHTEGEPLRVIIDGYPKILGDTILSKRNYLREHYDFLRTALMFEPRGHCDMYGAIIVDAENKDSNFGVLFMHNEGYSTMCGHGTLALAKLAVELQWVNVTLPITTVKIDAPCGQLIASVEIDELNQVKEVSFLNVASFVLARDESVNVKGIGSINYDIAYGGAFYAYVDADKISLALDKNNYRQIIDYGQRIKAEIVATKSNIKHPFEDDLSFLYGVIFITRLSTEHSKNVCVFADGEVDRSPTGSGVSGRVALHYDSGEIAINETITIESILATTFNVSVTKEVEYGSYKAVIPKVSGSAYITGMHEFFIDDNDKLNHGFFLR